jgi:hypothetical protein
MVESSPKDTPINEEELKALGAQLDSHKDQPEQALRLLKVLAGKRITAPLLKSTLIGKRLTAVSTDVEFFKGDESLLK